SQTKPVDVFSGTCNNDGTVSIVLKIGVLLASGGGPAVHLPADLLGDIPAKFFPGDDSPYNELYSLPELGGIFVDGGPYDVIPGNGRYDHALKWVTGKLHSQ